MNKWEKRYKFLCDQVQEMKKHAWIESEKAGKDIGAIAMREWVEKYADAYRKEWEKENGKVED